MPERKIRAGQFVSLRVGRCCSAGRCDPDGHADRMRNYALAVSVDVALEASLRCRDSFEDICSAASSAA